MQFTSFLEEGQLTVALTGEIDHHCAKAYIQAIAAKIEAYTPDTCVLDFRDVSFIDSSGIAVVMNDLPPLPYHGTTYCDRSHRIRSPRSQDPSSP